MADKWYDENGVTLSTRGREFACQQRFATNDAIEAAFSFKDGVLKGNPVQCSHGYTDRSSGEMNRGGLYADHKAWFSPEELRIFEEQALALVQEDDEAPSPSRTVCYDSSSEISRGDCMAQAVAPIIHDPLNREQRMNSPYASPLEYCVPRSPQADFKIDTTGWFIDVGEDMYIFGQKDEGAYEVDPTAWYVQIVS